MGRNLTGTTVDTSEASEWTISYVAEDQAGNIATTTRRVIVEDLISNSSNLPNETPSSNEPMTSTITPEVIIEDEIATSTPETE